MMGAILVIVRSCKVFKAGSFGVHSSSQSWNISIFVFLSWLFLKQGKGKVFVCTCYIAFGLAVHIFLT
jgi:hypothetical protein